MEQTSAKPEAKHTTRSCALLSALLISDKAVLFPWVGQFCNLSCHHYCKLLSPAHLHLLTSADSGCWQQRRIFLSCTATLSFVGKPKQLEGVESLVVNEDSALDHFGCSTCKYYSLKMWPFQVPRGKPTSKHRHGHIWPKMRNLWVHSHPNLTHSWRTTYFLNHNSGRS